MISPDPSHSFTTQVVQFGAGCFLPPPPMSPTQLVTFHHQPDMPCHTTLQTVGISSQPGSSLESLDVHGQQCQVDLMLLTQLTECLSARSLSHLLQGCRACLNPQVFQEGLNSCSSLLSWLSFQALPGDPSNTALQDNVTSRDTSFAPHLDNTFMSSL